VPPPEAMTWLLICCAKAGPASKRPTKTSKQIRRALTLRRLNGAGQNEVVCFIHPLGISLENEQRDPYRTHEFQPNLRKALGELFSSGHTSTTEKCTNRGQDRSKSDAPVCPRQRTRPAPAGSARKDPAPNMPWPCHSGRIRAQCRQGAPRRRLRTDVPASDASSPTHNNKISGNRLTEKRPPPKPHPCRSSDQSASTKKSIDIGERWHRLRAPCRTPCSTESQPCFHHAFKHSTT